jgi:polyhydroxyalkanoate synthesis regulator phasin
MSEQEVPTPKQQVDDVIVNVRNEAIVQTANLYLFGRQVMLTSVGMAALAIDAAQAIVQRAVERGEIMEADTHKLTTDLQQKASDRAKTANEARVEKTEQLTATLLENTNGILKRLGVPEMKVVFPDQPEAVTETEPNTDTDKTPSI